MALQFKNKSSSATARLKHDYLKLKKDPIPYVVAEPLPSNILEWHYIIEGPEETPYEGGFYHGKLLFPAEFPFRPPSIYMITPNGRFITNKKLCLSITDYHPDTWNPAWSVATILTGLVSFMTDNTKTLGSTMTTTNEKKQLAYQSLKFNLEDKIVQELFPDVCKLMKKVLKKKQKARSRIQGANEAKSEEGGNPVQFLRGPGLEDRRALLTNIAVVLGFAAFAYSVKYVLKNVAYD